MRREGKIGEEENCVKMDESERKERKEGGGEVQLHSSQQGKK